MREEVSLINILILVTCIAFNLLNALFFVFLFFKNRKERFGSSFHQEEIAHFFLLSLGIVLYTQSQAIIELSNDLNLNIVFHRLQHVGILISLLALADFPNLVFEDKKTNALHVTILRIMILATLPAIFTDFFISPQADLTSRVLQGTQTPFYYIIVGFYLLVILFNIIKIVFYIVEKRQKRYNLSNKEKYISLGLVALFITSSISVLDNLSLIPHPALQYFTIEIGMIFFALITMLLLTKEFGNTLESMIKNRDNLSHLRKTVEDEYEELLTTMANIIEKDDQYTAGHSKRVMKLSMEIGKVLGLRMESIDKIKKSGILHDIGKIGVSNFLINKPGKLTPEEFENVKAHSYLGFKIVSNYKPFYEIATYIKEHHEKLNGSGYPNSLTTEDLPIISKILTVADIYDALKSKRPYRGELTREKSLLIMQDMVEKNEIDLAIFKTLVDVTSYLLLE